MIIKKADVISLISFFSKKQKMVFGIFIFLSLLLMTLEIMAIYLLIPLMQMLTKSQIGYSDNIKFLEFLFFDNLLTNLVLVIFLLYTIKNIYAIALEYFKFNFAYNLKINLTKKLFSNYINESILFHLNNNSSKLIRNIEDVHTIINLTKSVMLLITEILIVMGISIFLIFLETKVAVLAILFLGVSSIIFYRSIQKKILDEGRIKQKNDSLRIMNMLQGFGGIRDIKILNKEKYFIDKFSFHDSLSAKATFLHNFLATLPKLIIEWLLILTIVFFIGIVAFNNDNYSYLITTLGIFLAAAFRLMPSVTRLLNAFQGINFYRNVVKTLKNEILSYDKKNFSIKKSKEDLSFNKIIKINNLSFRYPDKEKNILTNINFEINKKEKIGIMGESGSGKTTLINMILGLLQPNTGNIEVDGKEINLNLPKWHSYIGYVPQSTYLIDGSIKNNIAFGENDEIIKKENIYNSIKNAGLEKFVKGLKNGIDTNTGELGEKISGGERQRLGIARSLYRNPSLLILDEFTSSLDNENEQMILNEIFEKISNITIVLVSHRETTLRKCSRILHLINNEIKEL